MKNNTNQSHLIINDDEEQDSTHHPTKQLQTQNQHLTQQLTNLQQKLQRQTMEATKNNNSLNAQILAAQDEKNNISKKYFNLTEDYKELKQELSHVLQEREEAQTQQNVWMDKIQHIHEAAAQKEKILLSELEHQKQLCQTARVEYETKETHLREEYMERLGGMEEALEQAQGELDVAAKEKHRFAKQVKLKHEDMVHQQTALETKCQTLDLEIKKNQQEEEKLRGEGKQQQQMIHTLKMELSDADSKMKNEQQKIKGMEADMEELRKSHALECQQKQSKISTLKSSHKHILDQLQQLETKVADLNKDKQNQHAAMERNQQSFDLEKERHGKLMKSLQQELENRSKEIRRITSTAHQKSVECKKLEEESQVLSEDHRKQMILWQNEKLQLQNIIQNHKGKLSSANQVALDLQSQMDQKENDIQLLTVQKDKEFADMKQQMKETKLENDKLLREAEGKKDKLLKQLKDMSQKHEKDLLACKNNEKTILQDMEQLHSVMQINQVKHKKEMDELHNNSRLLHESISRLNNEKETLHIQINEQKLVMKRDVKSIKYLQLQVEEKAKDLEEHKREKLKISGDLQNITKIYESTKLELNSMENELSICISKKDKAEEYIQNQDQKLKKMSEDQTKKDNEINLLQKNLQKMRDAVDMLSRDKKELIRQTTNESNQYSDEIEELKDIILCQAGKLEFLLTHMNMEKRKRVQVESSTKSIIDDLSIELKTTTEMLNSERKRYTQESETSREKLRESERARESLIETHKAEVSSHKEDMDGMREKVKKLESDSDQLKAQLEGKKQTIERLSKELKDSRNRLSEHQRTSELYSPSSQMYEHEQSHISAEMKTLALRVEKALKMRSVHELPSQPHRQNLISMKNCENDPILDEVTNKSITSSSFECFDQTNDLESKTNNTPNSIYFPMKSESGTSQRSQRYHNCSDNPSQAQTDENQRHLNLNDADIIIDKAQQYLLKKKNQREKIGGQSCSQDFTCATKDNKDGRSETTPDLQSDSMKKNIGGDTKERSASRKKNVTHFPRLAAGID